LHHHKLLKFQHVKILATTRCQSAQDCAIQAKAMAQQPPSLEDILSQVRALQGQLTALQQVNQNLQNQLNAMQNAPPQPAGGAGAGAGVAWAPLPGGAKPTAFSLTPTTTNLVGLIDYSSKLGQSIYKQGCKKLTKDEGFQMTPSITAAFVKTFENRCSIIGWNQGTMGITKFSNLQGVTINIVKNYGRIDKPTLKAHCNKFC
jgi:hypothetical protein